jgi:tetratricopeptide (TPR) repeat protein
MTQPEFVIIEDEYAFNEKLNKILKRRDSERVREYFSSSSKREGIREKIDYLFNKEKFNASKELEFYSRLVKRRPNNPKARLKMAELYQKKGNQPKAVEEYLMAAEIYCKNNLFPQAMAIYKQVLKQNYGLEHVHFKIADIYRQMGFLGDAFYRYNLLLQNYNAHGEKGKAMEVMGLMAELDPRKFTLVENPSDVRDLGELLGPNGNETNHFDISGKINSTGGEQDGFYNLGEALESGSPIELKGYNEISMESSFGFKGILMELKETAGPSRASPNFNYHMGIACREMGFTDEAIEQFQVALDKGQNPFDAAKMLSGCYKEKGWWEEARQTLEKALQVEGITEEKISAIKKELDFVAREIEREREILGNLNILSVNQAERSNKMEMITNRGIGLQDAYSR